MGELAALVSIYEGMLLAHETNAPIKDGVLWPSVITLYSAMAMQSEFNGRMLEMIRELAGSSVISLPSSRRRFRQSGDRADDRALHALGLDGRAGRAPRWCGCCGTSSAPEFGSRHQQYEKFYGGSSFVVKQNVYRNFDFKRATALVDAALNLPPVAVTDVIVASRRMGASLPLRPSTAS